MPDRMPDRMPEDMSDRMPEDLPVRKSINVMVGITRSKVICSDSQKPPILSVQRRDRVPPPFLVSTVNFNRPSSGKLLILHYFTALLCILFQRLGLLGDIFIAHCKHFRGVSCTPNWSRAERNSHVCIGIWHSAPSRSGPGPMAAYGSLWQPMAWKKRCFYMEFSHVFYMFFLRLKFCCQSCPKDSDSPTIIYLIPSFRSWA